MKLRENNTKAYSIVFGLTVMVYILTCAPGLVWQDSGMIQYRIWENDIEGGLGLALSHPFYYIISIFFKFIPWLGFPLKINLVSPVVSGFAVANLFLLLKLWLKRPVPAVVGTLSLALAHTFWRHGTIPETYNLYTGLFILELVFLYLFLERGDKKFIYCLFFVNGLSIATHMFGVLPLAGYVCLCVYFLKEKKLYFKDVFIIAVVWAIGCGAYLYLIVKEFIATGDLANTVSSALFGNSWKSDVLNARFTSKILIQNILFLGLNFPTPNILLAAVGLFCVSKYADKHIFKGFLYALTVVFLVFASRYTVVDRYAFFIPFYCMVALFIGAGARYVLDKFNYDKKLAAVMIILAFLNVGVYFAAPAIAKRVGFSLGTRGDIKYRDDYKWFLQPWRTGYIGADRYALEVLEMLEPGSVIVADGTTLYPLLLSQKVKGLGEGVVIYSSHGTVDTAENYSDDFLKNKAKAGLLYSTREEGLKEFDSVKEAIVWKLKLAE